MNAVCLLHRARRKDALEAPLGFVGFEVQEVPGWLAAAALLLPPDASARLSDAAAFEAVDPGLSSLGKDRDGDAIIASLQRPRTLGRDLFVASWQDVCVLHGCRWPRPLPLVPLLVTAVPSGLRLLYQCTPEEATLIGIRLSIVAKTWLDAEHVRECDPAVLVDLLRRYVAADPTISALREDTRAESLHGWAMPWEQERLLVDTTGEPLSAVQIQPAGSAALGPLTLRTGPGEDDEGLRAARFSAYCRGKATTLVPTSLLFNWLRVTREDVDRASRGVPVYDRPLHDAGFAILPMRGSGSNFELFLPLRADNWRAHLWSVKEALQERLRQPVALHAPFKEMIPDVLRTMVSLMPRLLGFQSLITPPPAARPAAPLDRDSQVLLLARLRAVTGVEIPAAILPDLTRLPAPGEARLVN